ncbi:Crp/Fnr family transcriptional regulator [Comamonadaceae bacterium G21597-S1]|nr:Crp/Fnr family transcriptional regulator [Comamonadaceae bacterium G21597-S1]
MSTAPPHHATLARALLGRAIGFRDCAPSTLDTLVAAGALRMLDKGEFLLHRGGSINALGVLIEGSLESSITRRDGHRLLISYLQPGDLVGFMGLLDGMGHVTDLKARVASSMMMIPRSAIMLLRTHHIDVVRACESQLAYRSRILYDRLAADPSMPVEERLARLLSTWVAMYGLPREDGIVLDMQLSQSDLADTLGVSRQRINAAIGRLQQLGCIRMTYRKITITDETALQRVHGPNGEGAGCGVSRT